MTRRTPMRAWSLCAALAALAVPAAAAESPTPTRGEWTFRALLDGKPIGQHRFTLSAQGNERTLISDAAFDVTFLGITAYRYRHRASETWEGDCLAALEATTSDGGERSSVRVERSSGGTMTITTEGKSPTRDSVTGCLMSFAYWNPAMRAQTRLLNAQTGKLESVKIARIGTTSIDVHGAPVAALGWRISGAAQPIELWYAADSGDWIGLDAPLTSGRRLSYRIP